MTTKEKKIIGRIEKISFPEWGLTDLDAKVDTGAYTSSLHCHYIYLNDDGSKVNFTVLDPSHPEYEDKEFQCSVKKIKSVRSSNGLAEDRIIIYTTISLFAENHLIELSLTDRSEMRYPVLLGRKFIRKKFLVDVSKKYIDNPN